MAGGVKYTATVRQSPSGFLAECLELDAEGEGATREASLDALRAALADQVGHVEGVALPPKPASPPVIEIIVVSEPTPEKPGPSGPGDPG